MVHGFLETLERGPVQAPVGTNIGNILKMSLSSGFVWEQTALLPSAGVRGGGVQTLVAATCSRLIPIFMGRCAQGLSCNKNHIVLISPLHSIGLG